jgi:hypothetical protein
MNGTEGEIAQQIVWTWSFIIRVIEVAVLAVTAGFVCWYTIVTNNLKKETKNQTDVMIKPMVTLDIESEAFKTAPVSAFFSNTDSITLPLKNIGQGIAFNIQINIKPHEEDNLGCINTEVYKLFLETNDSVNIAIPILYEFPTYYADLFRLDHYKDLEKNIHTILEIKYIDVNKNNCFTRIKIDKFGFTINEIK